jgi:dTDP-3-amino-3,4,6-trideoxy-alpha-D-glucose transaminase
MAKIPFLSIAEKIELERGSLHACLDRVLDSRSFVLGCEVSGFEGELAADHGVPAPLAVTCNSGTDSLVIALRAMGVGFGDEVILPAHTAVPTVTAVRAVGALPVFCDIRDDTWVMDGEKAMGLISSKTKAIISVHLYGNAVDMKCLTPHRELVIEDVAQAQGGKFLGSPLGTWGRFGALSFYPTKNLGALGDGGALLCRNPEDAARARSLRFYGQSSRYKADLDLGMNSRLDELQAAFLRIRLPKYREELAAKAGLRSIYLQCLKDLPLAAQAVSPGCEPAWHLFVVAFETENLREKARAALESEGIGSLIHYPVPNHLQDAFREFRRPLPVTESLCRRILSLPLHAELSEDSVRKISACIAKAIKA